MAYYECECDNFDMTEGQDTFKMNEGIPGPGVPAGGSAGQVLRKSSSEDYDTEWDTLTAGDVAFNKESGYLSGTVGRYLQLLNSENVQYTYGGEKELGTVGETLDYLADKSVEIEEELNDLDDGLDVLKNTLNHKADVIYDTASGDIASFPDGADGLPVKDLTVGIEPVQDTSGGDPSPTHICPISGWTGCNVTRTGKNLLNYDAWKTCSVLKGTATFENNGVTLTASQNDCYTDFNPNQGYPAGAKIFVSPGETITLSWDVDDTSIAGNVLIFGNGSFGSIVSASAASKSLSMTIGSGISFVTFRLGVATSGQTLKYSNVMIRRSGDATFESYAGIIIPISWQSSAGTVYGGTLDVTSGVLTVDRAMVDLGTLTWEGAASGTVYRTRLDDGKSGLPNSICSARKVVYPNRNNLTSDSELAPYNTADSYICGLAASYVNAAAFKAAMSGVQLVYELAQPTTVTLTPTEVETLLGQNNVWADCGPVSVGYPADTKLYIQKINAPSDDDMIADAQIAGGKYFIVNNNLYISTTTILAGDPIKPGTNCTLTNLAAALNAINS